MTCLGPLASAIFVQPAAGVQHITAACKQRRWACGKRRRRGTGASAPSAQPCSAADGGSSEASRRFWVLCSCRCCCFCCHRRRHHLNVAPACMSHTQASRPTVRSAATCRPAMAASASTASTPAAAVTLVASTTTASCLTSTTVSCRTLLGGHRVGHTVTGIAAAMPSSSDWACCDEASAKAPPADPLLLLRAPALQLVTSARCGAVASEI